MKQLHPRQNYSMFINTQDTEVVLFKTTSSSSLRRFRFSLSSMLFIRAFLFPSITPCAEGELTGYIMCKTPLYVPTHANHCNSQTHKYRYMNEGCSACTLSTDNISM